MFYLGVFKHTLDSKNRLFIPARFREAIGPEFVILKSVDKCIMIYDNNSFEKLANQLSSYNGTAEGRNSARNFTRSATTVLQDKQGRFTVPADYVEHASLGTEVVITGEIDRLEIWSKEAFEAQEKQKNSAPKEEFPELVY